MFYSSSSDFDEKVAIRAAEYCEQIISEMGAEIHDDLVQKLSIMSFHIERIERAANDASEILRLTTRMRTDFEQAKESVRAISRRLHPVHNVNETFLTNMINLFDTMKQTTNGHIDCISTGTERALSRLTFTYLYRILQELIHNAFKHSAAWHIDVRIKWSPSLLTIEVEDDGTAQSRIDTITDTLANKRNTLSMRSHAIGAHIRFDKGKKGLLAIVDYPLSTSSAS